jgi:hypothetical protein
VFGVPGDERWDLEEEGDEIRTASICLIDHR